MRRHRLTDYDWDALTAYCAACAQRVRLRVRNRVGRAVAYTCRRGESGEGSHHDPRKRREERLRYKYGLTLEEYQIRWEAQQGQCLICCDELPASAIVDHDHETGVVRGLLCYHCNVGLGHFRDRPEILERAAKYLRRYRVA